MKTETIYQVLESSLADSARCTFVYENYPSRPIVASVLHSKN